jgi:hypothetical protein
MLTAEAEELRRQRREQAIRHVYFPRRPRHAVPAGAKDELYDFAAATIGNEPILYLEFGVYNGNSMRAIATRFRHPEARFVGFDSFEGLPETWHYTSHVFKKGTFTTAGRLPAISDPRISFVKGWFQNTLPEFLATLHLPPQQPVLVHYDADLYSSTLFILTSLWHRIADYFFLFDEFMSEEVIALYDFSLAYPIEFEFLSQTNPDRLPTQIFGRVKRIPFTPADD